MAMKVSKMDVWVGAMKDQPGALAAKLEPLACAGGSLEFVLARRAPEKKGKGVVFVSPVRGAKVRAAAKKARLRKSKSVCGLRVEGADKAGVGLKITAALASAGINLRGLSAGVVGRRFVMHVALDKAKDAAKAIRILRKL